MSLRMTYFSIVHPTGLMARTAPLVVFGRAAGIAGTAVSMLLTGIGAWVGGGIGGLRDAALRARAAEWASAPTAAASPLQQGGSAT